MKEMDEKELLDSTLRELGISAIDEYGFMLDLSGDVVIVYNKPVQINHIFEVKLKPKQAEITQDNLCRFYLKHKEWPKAKFWTMAPNRNKDSELMGIGTMSAMDASGELFDGAKITDPRWSELEVES